VAIAELHSAIFIAIKRPVMTGRNWPTADVRQHEKSISLYRSFRVLNFQRIHRQHPTHCRHSDMDLSFPKPAIREV
jgi:hypothetical protein